MTYPIEKRLMSGLPNYALLLSNMSLPMSQVIQKIVAQMHWKTKLPI